MRLSPYWARAAVECKMPIYSSLFFLHRIQYWRLMLRESHAGLFIKKKVYRNLFRSHSNKFPGRREYLLIQIRRYSGLYERKKWGTTVEYNIMFSHLGAKKRNNKEKILLTNILLTIQKNI